MLHNGEAEGSGLNISQTLIQSQIDVINEDFRRLNADRINTPTDFVGRAADFNIEFKLACVDPNGNPTNGVIRKQTSRTTFFPPTARRSDGSLQESSYSSIKKLPDGDLGWPPDQYLNIWVGSVGTVLGYSTFPQYVTAHPDEDGVVVTSSSFGRTGSGNYGLGRTLTHEIGHWLNLIHTWGDQNCGNDFCDDTPTQSFRTTGCPTFPRFSNCPNNGPSGDMFMNYMDYAYDPCQNLFTNDQKARARALFATIGNSSGPRAPMINNIFGFAGQPTTFTCTGSVRVSTICLPATWTVSGPATISSGQNTNQVSLSATGNGTVHLTATYGNYIAETDVTAIVGLPPSLNSSGYTYNGVTNPLRLYNGTTFSYNPVCNLQWSDVTTQFSGSASTPTWSKVTSNPVPVDWSQTSTGIHFNLWSVGQTAVFNVQATNSCGTTSYNFGFRSIDCSTGGGGGGCSRYAVSPNPAKSTLRISPNIPLPCRVVSIGKLKINTDPLIATVTIYDINGYLQLTQKFNNVKSATLDISRLKLGTYMVDISDGKTTERKQILIIK